MVASSHYLGKIDPTAGIKKEDAEKLQDLVYHEMSGDEHRFVRRRRREKDLVYREMSGDEDAE